jgi:hypothetical protein
MPETQFLVPDWGGYSKIDYGVGLLYWPARLHRMAGRYDNPMPWLTLSFSQGLRIWLLRIMVLVYSILTDGGGFKKYCFSSQKISVLLLRALKETVSEFLL